MTNWTEVNVYTGRPVDEDAPTNFAGTGSGVDMNPTGMKKKKKKLVDARTKSYKTHRAKLETARVKREAKRNGVKEEVELDEKIKIEFKTDPKNSNKTMIMKKGKHQGDIIKTNKGYQVMQFNKPAGKIFKSLDDIKPAVRKLYGEAKLIDKPTGEVLKTGSKEKMETEKKRNRDELQVKEWFKSKNIDVKVRELDESTQVYVPLGRRIPNEIREELIKTQYGKMPEDVKNVKDINYGNFMENSITMNNDFWTKVLHDTKGE